MDKELVEQFNKLIEKSCNLLVKDYNEDVNFVGDTHFKSLSNKALFSMFNRDQMIYNFLKGEFNEIQSLYQEVINRISSNKNIQTPKLNLIPLEDTIHGYSSFNGNDIALNVMKLMQSLENIDDMDFYTIEVLRTLFHEMRHQNQKKNTCALLEGSKEIKDFTNIERAEIFGYLSNYLYSNVSMDVLGLALNKEIDKNIKFLHKEKIEKNVIRSPHEIQACLFALNSVVYLQKMGYLNNETAEDSLFYITNFSNTYNYEKFRDLTTKDIKRQPYTILSSFKEMGLNNNYINKLFKLTKSIDWDKYIEYIHKNNEEIKNTINNHFVIDEVNYESM